MALRTALVQAVPRGLWIVMCVLALGASMAEGCGDNTGAGGSGGAGGMAGAVGAGGMGGAPMCEGPLDCNDGNPCTENLCDPADGTCSNPTLADGTTCSADGNPGQCVASVCTGLCEFVGCGDGNECTEDVCDPADGSCFNPPVSNGTVCEAGGDPGQCSSGLCVGLCAEADCDDGKECTEDLCDRADGTCNSLNRPDGSDCELGGLPGRCMSGTCMDAALCREVDCGDGNECTEDACNPTTAVCTNPNKVDGAFCETDGNPGLCSTGQCRGLCELVTCDDGNQCTISLCDPSNGSCPNPDRTDGSPCDYGDLPGRCSAGLCVGLCAGVVCNDHEQCTLDACNPSDGTCVYGALTDGTSCDVGGDAGVCDAGACRARRWGTPVLVENDDAGSAGGAELVVDPSGNVTAVWQQDDGTGNYHIWSNRYPSRGSWGVPVPVETLGGASAYDVGVDAKGNVTAVWQQDDGTGKTEIRSNRYPAGGSWGTPVLVSAANTPGSYPRLAVDPEGNATAVWGEVVFDPRGDGYVWSNRHPAGGPWGAPSVIDDVGRPRGLQVAVNDGGNVTAVWEQGSVGGTIRSNRYPAAGPWGTAVVVVGAYAYYPAVVADANGNVTVLWSGDLVSLYPYAIRYPAGGPWDRLGVALDPDYAQRPGGSNRLTVDPDGNVTALWILAGWGSDYTGDYAISSSRYPAAGPWGTAGRISDGVGDAYGPNVACDANGNVTAVWSQDDGTGNWNILSNRYTPTRGWGTPSFIDADKAGGVEGTNVAVDPAGNATAVWSQEVSPEGRKDIWSSRFE